MDGRIPARNLHDLRVGVIRVGANETSLCCQGELYVALGHDEEVAMHVRATANTGASREDICEAFLHVAIYAGVPAANRAFKIAKEVFSQMDGGKSAHA